MENNLLEIVDTQSEVIKIQSDIISKLFTLLMQYMTVEAEEMKYNPPGELWMDRTIFTK